MPLTAIDSPTYDTLPDVSAMVACSRSHLCPHGPIELEEKRFSDKPDIFLLAFAPIFVFFPLFFFSLLRSNARLDLLSKNIECRSIDPTQLLFVDLPEIIKM